MPAQKPIILAQIQAILAQYGSESNVPYPHEYWKLLNQYRDPSFR